MKPAASNRFHMTLQRLLLIVAALVLLVSIVIAWLWEYAYSPEGRARVIVAQLSGEPRLRRWLLDHKLIRPGFDYPFKYTFADELDRPSLWHLDRPYYGASLAAEEWSKLGPQAVPVAVEGLASESYSVRLAAICTCGKLNDPCVIRPLVDCMRKAAATDPEKEYIQKGYSISRYEVEWTIKALKSIYINTHYDPKVLDAIRTLTNDPDERVRQVAANALSRL